MTVIKKEKKMKNKVYTCDDTEKYISRRKKKFRDRTSKVKMEENEKTEET